MEDYLLKDDFECVAQICSNYERYVQRSIQYRLNDWLKILYRVNSDYAVFDP